MQISRLQFLEVLNSIYQENPTSPDLKARTEPPFSQDTRLFSQHNRNGVTECITHASSLPAVSIQIFFALISDILSHTKEHKAAMGTAFVDQMHKNLRKLKLSISEQIPLDHINNCTH